MKTIYRYPGSKAKLLPQISKHLYPMIESSKSYFDGFVGGGSVLLKVAQDFPKINLFCNDKDNYISSFFQLMSTGSNNEVADLKKRLEEIPTLDKYYKLRNDDCNDLISLAYKGLFFNRTSFSGDMRRAASPIGGKNQISKYKVNCRYNPFKLIEKVEQIRKLLKDRLLVSNEDILNCNFIRDKDITAYLDPPYYRMGKMLYEKHMNHEEHVRLSEVLKNRNNWVLSYDNCEEIRNLYAWAEIDLVNVNYCIKGKKISWDKTSELMFFSNINRP